MIGVNQQLTVQVYPSSEAAEQAGYNYNQWGQPPVPVEIVKAVIVKKGTLAGNSTVDLLLTDATGKMYVTMITGQLLKALPL